MKIYLSHPITDLEPHEYLPIFEKYEADFLSKGFEVVNPTKLKSHRLHDKKWTSYMLADLAELSSCDILVLLAPLKKLEKSTGCMIEMMWAKKMKIDTVPFEMIEIHLPMIQCAMEWGMPVPPLP